jgi:hypothetical protein
MISPRTTEILEKQNTIFNASRTTDVAGEQFVLGNSYSYEDYHIFALADDTLTFVFDPTAFTGTNLTVEPISFCATSGPITIDFYTGTDADDDGTLLGASNRRATSSNINEAILRLDPTINSIGTRFSGDLVPATGTAPANSSGGSNVSGLPFELDTSLKYAFVATNKDGANVYFCIKMTWFEI